MRQRISGNSQNPVVPRVCQRPGSRADRRCFACIWKVLLVGPADFFIRGGGRHRCYVCSSLTRSGAALGEAKVRVSGTRAPPNLNQDLSVNTDRPGTPMVPTSFMFVLVTADRRLTAAAHTSIGSGCHGAGCRVSFSVAHLPCLTWRIRVCLKRWPPGCVSRRWPPECNFSGLRASPADHPDRCVVGPDSWMVNHKNVQQVCGRGSAGAASFEGLSAWAPAPQRERLDTRLGSPTLRMVGGHRQALVSEYRVPVRAHVYDSPIMFSAACRAEASLPVDGGSVS